MIVRTDFCIWLEIQTQNEKRGKWPSIENVVNTLTLTRSFLTSLGRMPLLMPSPETVDFLYPHVSHPFHVQRLPDLWDGCRRSLPRRTSGPKGAQSQRPSEKTLGPLQTELWLVYLLVQWQLRTSRGRCRASWELGSKCTGVEKLENPKNPV